MERHTFSSLLQINEISVNVSNHYLTMNHVYQKVSSLCHIIYNVGDEP